MDLDSTTTSPATSTMDLGPGVVLLGDRGRGSVEVYRLPGKLVAATKEEEVGETKVMLFLMKHTSRV